MNYVNTLAVVMVLGLSAGTAARAQEKPAPVVTSLKVQVVISRYQGEKKISSLPYALSVNAGTHGLLRMGTRIPVMSTSFPPKAEGAPQVGSFNYQDVGTNIDCDVAGVDDGRFRVQITLDDSSVYPNDQAKPGAASTGNPSFRSFKASDSMVLKDGQTAQFTTATDKVTGETVKVDVTLTVVK